MTLHFKYYSCQVDELLLQSRVATLCLSCKSHLRLHSESFRIPHRSLPATHWGGRLGVTKIVFRPEIVSDQAIESLHGLLRSPIPSCAGVPPSIRNPCLSVDKFGRWFLWPPLLCPKLIFTPGILVRIRTCLGSITSAYCPIRSQPFDRTTGKGLHDGEIYNLYLRACLANARDL